MTRGSHSILQVTGPRYAAGCHRRATFDDLATKLPDRCINEAPLLEDTRQPLRFADTRPNATAQSLDESQSRRLNMLNAIGWRDKDITPQQLHTYQNGYMDPDVYARKISLTMVNRGLTHPGDNQIWINGRRARSGALKQARGPDLRHVVFANNPETMKALKEKTAGFHYVHEPGFPPNPNDVDLHIPGDTCDNACVEDGGRRRVCLRRAGIFGHPVSRGSFLFTVNSSLDTLGACPEDVSPLASRQFRSCGDKVACPDGDQPCDITQRVARQSAAQMSDFQDRVVNAHKVINFRRYPQRLPPTHGPARPRPYQFDNKIANIMNV